MTGGKKHSDRSELPLWSFFLRIAIKGAQVIRGRNGRMKGYIYEKVAKGLSDDISHERS